MRTRGWLAVVAPPAADTRTSVSGSVTIAPGATKTHAASSNDVVFRAANAFWR
jgi:hypothetical protein